MANTFLTNTFNNNYDDTTPVIAEIITDNLPLLGYTNKTHNTLNNYRLCTINPDIDCVDTTPVVTTVDITPTLPGEYTLSRTLSLTYEVLYKNLASYNSNTNMVTKKYFIKTYYLPDNKTIQVITDMNTVNTIISSISGDTGYDNVLIRTITYIKNEKIDTVYTLGGTNG